MSFIILGNASSGTSFCSYVMDAHPGIVCPFEEFRNSYDETLELWRKRQAEFPDLIYGTKVPIEEVILRHWRWTIDDVIALVDEFDIIFNWREFHSWRLSWNDRQAPHLDPILGERWWNAGWEIATQMQHRRPGRVWHNQYERLCEDLPTYANKLYKHVGAEPFTPNPDMVRQAKYR